MYTMMTTTGWGFGLIFLWGLHILSVVAFFIGVLFFVVLAIKKFTAQQLKNWAIGLIILGTVGCLFTIAFMGHPWIGSRMGDFGFGGRMPMTGQWQNAGQGAESDSQPFGGMMQRSYEVPSQQ